MLTKTKLQEQIDYLANLRLLLKNFGPYIAPARRRSLERQIKNVKYRIGCEYANQERRAVHKREIVVLYGSAFVEDVQHG